ncbi:MAG: alpha-amylase/4-alpha-glucanotransferase domain-containing protein, partial [Chloroflexota bacterium]
VLVFKPSYGGSLVEWDWRDRRYNLLNTMTRREEGYHESLRQAAEQGRLFLPGDPEIPGGVKVKRRDIHTCLFYDRHRRVALMDHFLHADTTPESFYQARYSEEGDFIGEPYQATVEESDGQAVLLMTREGTVSVGQVAFPVRVEKHACVLADSGSLQVHYRVTNLDDIPADLRFGVEFNWGIVGGDSSHAYLKVGSEERRLNDLAGDDDVSGFTIGSSLPVLAGEVRVIPSRPTSLWHFPLEVVSNSEAGYECAYQGTCTLLWWAMHLEARRPWEVELTLELRDSRT